MRRQVQPAIFRRFAAKRRFGRLLAPQLQGRAARLEASLKRVLNCQDLRSTVLELGKPTEGTADGREVDSAAVAGRRVVGDISDQQHGFFSGGRIVGLFRAQQPREKLRDRHDHDRQWTLFDQVSIRLGPW